MGYLAVISILGGLFLCFGLTVDLGGPQKTGSVGMVVTAIGIVLPGALWAYDAFVDIEDGRIRRR